MPEQHNFLPPNSLLTLIARLPGAAPSAPHARRAVDPLGGR